MWWDISELVGIWLSQKCERLKPKLVTKILLPGDEVLQWNGKLLPRATMKEVYDIILESQAEPQVELVVSRPIG